MRRAAILALLLAACRPDAPVAAPAPQAPLPKAVARVSDVVAPAVVEAIESVAASLPAPPPAPPAAPLVHPEAVALIVRWEIGSPAQYQRKYRGVIWPGAASGPTWGVGYDGGHMPRPVIADDWQAHAQVDRLVTTSGVTGQRAKAELHRWRGVLTEYDYAYLVFSTRSLIEYERLARRTFRDGYDALPGRAKGVLVSLVYNRGGGMTGDSRREMRVLRDECVPAGDLGCMARAIRAMKRLWPTLRGLRDRRDDEARLIELDT